MKDYKPFIIGTRAVNIWKIPVRIADNEEDWTFAFIDAGNGKKQMAVF